MSVASLTPSRIGTITSREITTPGGVSPAARTGLVPGTGTKASVAAIRRAITVSTGRAFGVVIATSGGCHKLRRSIHPCRAYHALGAPSACPASVQYHTILPEAHREFEGLVVSQPNASEDHAAPAAGHRPVQQRVDAVASDGVAAEVQLDQGRQSLLIRQRFDARRPEVRRLQRQRLQRLEEDRAGERPRACSAEFIGTKVQEAEG